MIKGHYYLLKNVDTSDTTIFMDLLVQCIRVFTPVGTVDVIILAGIVKKTGAPAPELNNAYRINPQHGRRNKEILDNAEKVPEADLPLYINSDIVKPFLFDILKG